ncbi:cobalt-precorrin 5A hydrolase [Pseudorhodobacter antarcticus]|jgi:cobalt-precorrin 5A hydrolase|uniref:Cobalt-precorrin 5A hydrolase n=1 Tax=Pseudorhodobacter antarcticus TaxID=1077947 RepID=A0A1H8LMD7_9RHOB|nr:cobalamin biosynthesis protein [Pseudorhodobacter antarcticus]SEO06257.1 cobalt-precorrin 5A hydrolase [Pseudorhodobacter antarcticus]
MIVAGFGLRASATEAGLRALLGDVRPGALAVVADKAGHLGLVALAKRLGVPLCAVPVAALVAGVTPAPRQPARYGAMSVAEGAALAAAGPGAVLIAPRIIAIDGRATMALAKRNPL